MYVLAVSSSLLLALLLRTPAFPRGPGSKMIVAINVGLQGSKMKFQLVYLIQQILEIDDITQLASACALHYYWLLVDSNMSILHLIQHLSKQ